MTQRRKLVMGALTGAALSIPLAALLYLGFQAAALPMLAFDVFEGLTRIQALGGLVTKAIDLMVTLFSHVPGAATDQLAKGFEQLSAVALFVVIGAVIGALFALYRERQGKSAPLNLGLVLIVLAFGLEFVARPALGAISIGGIWLAVLIFGWAYALAWLYDRLAIPPALESAPVNVERRQFLIQFGGALAALTVVAWGAGSLLGRRETSVSGQPIAAGPTMTPQPGASSGAAATQGAAESGNAIGGNFAVVAGARPELTSNDQFYRVDVNLGAPEIDPRSWSLAVGGLVNKPLSISYDDLTKMPAVKQLATLECISNPVGGDLISTTEWTGVRLYDVLKLAGLQDGVVEIKFTCADGYTESLPMDAVMDEQTLLVYAMNGMALPDIHGFPLRIYTPNRYGMKNPKWVTTLEAIRDPYDGYWEVRGWDKQAIVKTTSVIDAVSSAKTPDGSVPVGGIAFAGKRGISKVEVALDSGDWQQAELKEPLSPLTWRLWRINTQATKGPHSFRVRATDGTGAVQTSQVADLHPDGASGYNSIEADVS
ncbi:MAG TPA: molybdopterin-dependent oxidoreductase [Aggregatilineales bacterium]|nr:molybdopterin-dependent oxidoreductase [Aggregatilineales bacterium]